MRLDDAIKAYARGEAAAGRNWDSIADELRIERWRMKGILQVQRRMSPMEADVCALRADEFSISESAARLGIDKGLVRSRLSTARRAGYQVRRLKAHPSVCAGAGAKRASLFSLCAQAMVLAGGERRQVRAYMGFNQNQIAGVLYRLRENEADIRATIAALKPIAYREGEWKCV